MRQPESQTANAPKRSPWTKVLLVTFGIALYLISTVPIGMVLYAIKTEMGWDIFRHGGYHTLAACLREAARP